ncbi:MAG: transcription antitermination factor NusB [Firmicutes bacterium]|nr:transcription antitermination factor NusB [Bacillota bacterium]
MTRSEAREHVFRILFETEFLPGQDIDELINVYLENFSEEEMPKGKELEFIRREVKGTLSHLDEIDEKIKGSLRGWSLKRIPRCDRAILRLAIYEIENEEGIPASVSINEAIELAKRYSEASSGSFVNGVLANFVPAEEK